MQSNNIAQQIRGAFASSAQAACRRHELEKKAIETRLSILKQWKQYFEANSLLMCAGSVHNEIIRAKKKVASMQMKMRSDHKYSFKRALQQHNIKPGVDPDLLFDHLMKWEYIIHRRPPNISLEVLFAYLESQRLCKQLIPALGIPPYDETLQDVTTEMARCFKEELKKLNIDEDVIVESLLQEITALESQYMRLITAYRYHRWDNNVEKITF